MNESNNDKDDTHFLNPFLEEWLNDHGLDYEAYAPYVTSSVPNNEDDHDDDMEDIDMDDFDDIVQLLQASSETHSEDENVWSDFKSQVLERIKDQRLKRRNDQKKCKEMESLQNSMNQMSLAQEAAKAASNSSDGVIDIGDNNKSSVELSEEKRLLLERYGYEDDEDEDDERGGDCGDDEVLDNRTMAKKVEFEKNEKMRKEYALAKKQSKEATARGKLERSTAKEQRKQRTGKSERKR